MAYTIIDLLDKFISIERSGYKMYMEVASKQGIHVKIKALAKIFANEKESHIYLYNSLREKIKVEADFEVDFNIYDKASKIVFEFLKMDRKAIMEDVKRFLQFCLNYEKENLALVLSIQGILVRAQADTETMNYKILEEIVIKIQKHIQNISYFSK